MQSSLISEPLNHCSSNSWGYITSSSFENVSTFSLSCLYGMPFSFLLSFPLINFYAFLCFSFLYKGEFMGKMAQLV